MMQEVYLIEDDGPPPIVRTRYSAEQEALWAADVRYAEACQRACAESLVYAAARQTRDMDVVEAWEAFKTMPASSLEWLYTPSGWCTLIDGLRIGLGLDGPAPHVTIH